MIYVEILIDDDDNVIADMDEDEDDTIPCLDSFGAMRDPGEKEFPCFWDDGGTCSNCTDCTCLQDDSLDVSAAECSRTMCPLGERFKEGGNGLNRQDVSPKMVVFHH